MITNKFTHALTRLNTASFEFSDSRMACGGTHLWELACVAVSLGLALAPVKAPDTLGTDSFVETVTLCPSTFVNDASTLQFWYETP
jgi:hypothetical protein